MKYSYQQIQESDDRIWKLFENRCVMCGKSAHSIHEIRPRSLDVNWLRDENRVTLCILCHNDIHRVGTKHSVKQLSDKRNEWVKNHGRQ